MERKRKRKREREREVYIVYTVYIDGGPVRQPPQPHLQPRPGHPTKTQKDQGRTSTVCSIGNLKGLRRSVSRLIKTHVETTTVRQLESSSHEQFRRPPPPPRPLQVRSLPVSSSSRSSSGASKTAPRVDKWEITWKPSLSLFSDAHRKASRWSPAPGGHPSNLPAVRQRTVATNYQPLDFKPRRGLRP